MKINIVAHAQSKASADGEEEESFMSKHLIIHRNIIVYENIIYC